MMSIPTPIVIDGGSSKDAVIRANEYLASFIRPCHLDAIIGVYLTKCCNALVTGARTHTVVR